MDKRRIALIGIVLAAVVVAAYYSMRDKNGTGKVNIGKSDIKIEDGRLTPEVLWSMGRIGGVVLSPDATRIAYQVTYYSVKENASHTVIYVMDEDGGNAKLLTRTSKSEHSPVWIDNDHIAFLSVSKGVQQIFSMDADGKHRRQLSFTDKDVEGFLFSPDLKNVLMVMSVPNPLVKETQYEDLPKASGMIADDLMFRHWDTWVTTLPHPFLAAFDGKRVADNSVDLLEGEPYESPLLPFGGVEQFAWSPDGKSIAYTCRKKAGAEYTKSTDSDIYLYSIESGETKNLCKLPGTEDLNMGYDINPKFSADGRYIAWQSMERDGYESDINRLYVMDLNDGSKKSVSGNFDSNVDDFIWAGDKNYFYFIGSWQGCMSLFTVDMQGNVIPVNTDACDYNSLALGNRNRLIVTRQSMKNATEIYSVDTRRGLAEKLTNENGHIFSQLDNIKVEARAVKTTDGKDMLTWVVFPPNFDETKKYPTVLFCEGGPQSMVSQFWSYRWNFRIMAAQGYIVVAPNRRGLPGFGKKWLEDISGDYGGQCMKDLLSAIDDISKESYVDKDRLGCVGASFGGYSVYWLAGHHEGRFKCFIAHDGIFNLEQQYLETEEMWFPQWDLGGPFWDKNKVTESTYATSPHLFADKWDTPILCIHGEKDYRILYSQAVSAFQAARLRGVPAELLLFPDENHWVLKPQNGVLWQRTYFNWLDRWLKN
ncbi:MAG: S9 family peptidase [Bacteroidaceae bacterium]|nr:S9 family peptidase [Bacteroidaceae bacterium]